MGTEVYFHCGRRTFGHVHFSAFTMRRQHKVYGMDFGSCLTYDDGDDKEMIGPKGVDDYHGRFTPDWPRAKARVAKLIAKCEALPPDHHRRLYDLDRFRAYQKLILACANHERPERCTVELSD